VPERSYERSLDSPPQVDLLDWQLLERLFALFEEYAGEVGRPEDGGRPAITVRDNRGSFTAESLAELQDEIGQLDDPSEWSVTLDRFDHDSDYYIRLHVWASTQEYKRGGKFVSTREADVVHVAERTADIFQRAHTRREARLASERPLAPSLVPGRSWASGYLRDVSAQAIGGALSVVIVGTALAAWAIFFR
jgi:hypothetical protein